jgi:hypothetical protein
MTMPSYALSLTRLHQQLLSRETVINNATCAYKLAPALFWQCNFCHKPTEKALRTTRSIADIALGALLTLGGSRPNQGNKRLCCSLPDITGMSVEKQ